MHFSRHSNDQNTTSHWPASVDKIEDQKARAAVKAQIEADKKARAERTAREKALREGREITDNMAGQSPASGGAGQAAQQTSASAGVAGKDFKETRLQIRLSTGGQPLVTTLSSDARTSRHLCCTMTRMFADGTMIIALREVAEFVASQNLSFNVDTVSFSQHFPRSVA